ncbi:tripartite tricarboxylate transporter substrate binding protein [Pseudoroseomonas cervicalis]|uniref:Bug family tripartite tricarboxylate transporter substrate binding protein n=1 Tax=Teichococcus cervicalis TaxID=204525 RepID=UPI0027864B9D|nr:tripartite tricarboxylate transporter substrate-binding protein [Pseudoroseomonas cervicalis]MDQ1081851.1 tripartite-type tricarboxylate transporter receptor subunit TctC [Pseudoroseomonas cervicalis]
MPDFPPLRRRGLLAAGLATPLALARPSLAQPAWPQRPVRLLVPYSPGGGTDIFARALAEGLSQALGQTVLVENRAGANGAIGSEMVARAEPDGSVFLVDTGSLVMNRYVMPSLSYEALRDFAPVSLLSRYPLLLTASVKAPFGDVAGLVAAARAAPRSIGFGTSDAAISYAGNLFTRLAGIEMVEVSYRGAAPILNDLVAGHLPTGWNSTVAAAQHLAAGRIRALGVTTTARTPLLPEVPTLQEAGVPGYDFAGWYAMVGPAGLPPAIAARMHEAVLAALEMPRVRERLLSIGADLGTLGPAPLAAFLREDDARWAEAARQGLITRAQ